MSSESRLSGASRKRSKKARKLSSDNISIEELFDMSYDADAEVIQPTRYDDPDTESDDDSMPDEQWHNLDEELAARMCRLGQDNSLEPLPSTRSERGRKRKSRDMADADSNLNTPQSPDLEVHEMVETADGPSPAKRSRRRSRRPNVAQHILRAHNNTWTDSSEKAESKEQDLDYASTSPTTASRQNTPQYGDEEAMDIS